MSASRVTYERALVLLSGGADSTAALCLAIGRYAEVAAIGFDYGQPNRDHEMTAAQRIAGAVGVPFARIVMADTIATGRGLLGAVRDHDPTATGLNPAFVPGRNAVFLTAAAAHACSRWPSGNLAVVIGATGEDSAGFPDCRRGFFDVLSLALRYGYAREITIDAPFTKLSKAEVIAQLDESSRDIVATSWSCYRASGPCGACTACMVRAAAFAELGLKDFCAPERLTGGDPERG